MISNGNDVLISLSGSDFVTNCITEIPQDIKLELKDGTLTLKAGSKVYVPNGAGVFDVLNITSDKTVNCFSTTGKTLIRIYPDQQPYGDVLVSSWYSGSNPSGITGMFYNTTTNKITFHQNGVSDGNIFSLPIAEITVNNGQVTSIDQVFNGFGYIGSHLFSLPGVKGLTPLGRNEDGTLCNGTLVNTNVNIVPSVDFSSISSGFDCNFFTIGDSFYAGYKHYYEQVEQPENITYTLWFNPNENKMYQGDGTSWVETSLYKQGEYKTDSTGKITYFKPYLPFVAVNKNDTAVKSAIDVKGSLPLLTSLWSDHLLNDESYLRADTFSWQSGGVYSTAYNELLNEYNSVKPGEGFVQVGYAWKKSDGTIKYTRLETPTAFSTEIGGNCMLFVDSNCIDAGSPVTWISSVGSGKVTDGSGNTWTRDSSSDVYVYLKWTPVNLTEYKYSSNNYVTDGTTVWKGKGNYNKTSETDIFDNTKLTYWKTNTSYTAAVLAEYGTATGNTYTGYTVEIFSSTQTETIGDTTITFVKTPKGYKIVDATQEQNAIDIYNNTGVSWYYILDNTNTRFKLPRSKYNFVGLRDNVGSYVSESLPNISSGNAQVMAWYNDTATWQQGAFKKDSTINASIGTIGSWTYTGTTAFNAAYQSSTYQDGAPVQQRATQMYLYFYVGNFSKTATEQTAGLNVELFNGKMDSDMSNMNASQTTKEIIVGWGMPDWDKASTAFSGNLYNSEKTYTLPDNGFVFITTQNQSNVGSSTNLTNNKSSYVFKTFSMGVGGKDYGQYFGGKGEIISLSATSASTAITSIFVPLKGAN